MNTLRYWLIPLLALGLSGPPARAQNSEQSRYYIQQMIELAAAHDENGVTTLRRVLEQNPRPSPVDADAARTALNRGLAALEQNEPTAALSAFQQAGRNDPGNIDAISHLGLLYRKLNRLKEAEIALQQALALDPTRAVAWFQIAQVYGLQNDGRRALGALANTYRFAQNPMRAEEILRNIAENEAADTLRNAALETLRLYRLPAQAVIVPPSTPNAAIAPLKAPANPARLHPTQAAP
ncbi:MAG: tetratricopeptide repeat protein [Candidatus Competibacteraceae bacterium]|nr:tetratricopeptide repeat protein [Candidatus Competibacteraceae bacterium]